LVTDLVNVPLPKCALIEALQPYKGPYGKSHPLAILQELNNLDKHQLMPDLQIGIFEGQFLLKSKIRHRIVKQTEATFMEPGTVMMTVEFPDTLNVKRDVDVEVTLSADISFDKASRLYGMSLFQTLLAIRAYIHQEVFVEPLIDGFDWNFVPRIPLDRPWQQRLPPPGPLRRSI
jgi:hypothetical protein